MMTTALLYLDKENRKYISLFLENRYTGMLVGGFGCLVVVAPYALLYQGVALTDRGGMVDSRLLLPLLTFAMLGNFLEEGLFRGYVLGVLKERNKPLVAGIYSGLVFALCHVFLATTVTDIGLPLLFFTLWEGAIAGLIGAKYGLMPATLCHGGAIFLASSGLF